MTLHHCGEDRLVAQLIRRLPSRPDVRVGPGDDCAVVGAPRAARWQLLKTDAVIEGIHFLSGEKMRRVGWKALCRAISDIAAMGGVPEHALVTIALSPDTELAQITDFYTGLHRAARRFGIAIVGGETSRSPGPFFCSVTVTGSVERKRCILRSTGTPGDALYVTGRLGGSLAGKHLDFTPRLAEARWLTEHFSLTAMMDLSDGLGSDLPRLAAASRCGFELNEAAVPRTSGCSLAQALSDGEDFELLFAMTPRDTARLESAWKQRFPRLPLTCIGRLSEPSTRNSQLPTSLRGHDHFA